MSETSRAMRLVLWRSMVARNRIKYDLKAKTMDPNDRAETRLHMSHYWTLLPSHSLEEPNTVTVDEFKDGRTVMTINMLVVFFGSLRDALEMLVDWEDCVNHARNAELDKLNAQAILSELTLSEQ